MICMAAIWRKNLEHQGIEIEFDGKPSEEIRTKLKGAGFRWSRYQKIWYAKGFYGYAKIVAEQLAEYGGEIGEVLSIAEKMDQKVERADARSVRFSVKAESTKEHAQALFDESHKMAEIIPLGQPILVGHYSEKSDRRYRERMQNKMFKGCEEFKKAEYYEHRSEAAANFERRTFNLGTTLRRIQKLKAEWRRWWRSLDDTQLRIKQGWGEKISRASLEHGDRVMDRLDEEIAYWEKIVLEKADKGLKVWGPEDFQVGERISANGRAAVIEKINKKTIRVKYDLDWMNHLTITKVPYDTLSQKCKGEA